MTATLAERRAGSDSVGKAGGEAAGRSYGDAAIRGVRTTAIAQFLRVALGLLTTAILAKSLTPGEFGLVGMAGVVLGFVLLFKDLGTGAAVVQRDRLDDTTLASLFWMNCALGASGTLLLALAAPLVARLFAEPLLTGPLIGLAFTLAISGPAVVPQALLQRRLGFATLARIEIVSQLVGSAVAITLAFLGTGCWSLVVQVLVAQSLATLGTVAAAGYRPRAAFSLEALRAVAAISGPLVGFQVFNYFARNADQALLGRFVGAAAVGDYALATRLVMQPLGSATQVTQRVLLPVCARMQNDPPRMQAAYLRAVGAISAALFPLLALLLALDRSIVLGLFGEAWQGMIPLLGWLGWVGILQTLTSTTSVIYQAVGRTDLMFGWGVLSGTAALFAFWWSAASGPVAVAHAFFVTALVLLWPGLWLPCRLIGLPMGFLLAEVAGPAALAVLTGFVASRLDALLVATLGPLGVVLVVAPVALLFHAGAVFLFDREHARDVARLASGGSL